MWKPEIDLPSMEDFIRCEMVARSCIVHVSAGICHLTVLESTVCIRKSDCTLKALGVKRFHGLQESGTPRSCPRAFDWKKCVGQRRGCKGCIMPDTNLRGIVRQNMRKPIFCNRIRPRAFLARLTGTRSRSGLSWDLFGHALAPVERRRPDDRLEEAKERELPLLSPDPTGSGRPEDTEQPCARRCP